MKNNSANVLSSQELASFCSQISSVLKAGISPSEGIAIMLEDTSAEEERQILTAIQETLNTTGVFSLGLEDAKVFPEYMMNMVQLGEQAGRLDDVMEALALHYERESGLAAAIKSAVTYPCIMIGMMVLVVLVLITKVLPVFDQVFRQLGQNMSGFSKSLLLLGNSLNRYSGSPSNPCRTLLLLCQNRYRQKVCCKTFLQASLHQGIFPQKRCLPVCQRNGSGVKKRSYP